jgi:hypothetical protein
MNTDTVEHNTCSLKSTITATLFGCVKQSFGSVQTYTKSMQLYTHVITVLHSLFTTKYLYTASVWLTPAETCNWLWILINKWCVRRLIIGLYTNKQTNKRYESHQIKVVHECNQWAKCWYFKAKVCSIFINDRFLRGLKETFISLLPDHYAQRLPSLITFTNCSYALCSTKWKFVEQWMSTLPKLVSGHKMSSEVPQVSFYTESL